MEEVKKHYAACTAKHLVDIYLLAQSYAERPKKKIGAIKIDVVHVRERLSKVNKDLDSNDARGKKAQTRCKGQGS